MNQFRDQNKEDQAAIKQVNRVKWQEAIDSELKSIAENEVSEVVQKVDQKTIQT